LLEFFCPSKGRKKVQIFTSLASKQTAVNSPFVYVCRESTAGLSCFTERWATPTGATPLQASPLLLPLGCPAALAAKVGNIYYSGTSVIEGTHDPFMTFQKKKTQDYCNPTPKSCVYLISLLFVQMPEL
jgi:hypothetical protein